ncbi:hypothetical protein C4573_05610 [Candidatus Woesearchaeota archaeon]|nr:MAG: hypothetical protein C4573_05610 [Candidatus Woesearchaeota archaeon]
MADLSNLVYIGLDPTEPDTTEEWHIDFTLRESTSRARFVFNGDFLMPKGYEQAIDVFYDLWKNGRFHLNLRNFGERLYLDYQIALSPFFCIEASFPDDNSPVFFEIAALMPALKTGFFVDYKPDYDRTLVQDLTEPVYDYPLTSHYADRPLYLSKMSNALLETAEVQDLLCKKPKFLMTDSVKIISPEGHVYRPVTNKVIYL